MFRRPAKARSVSAAASDGQGSEKKVMAKATFVLEGVNASDVKELLEVLHRHLRVVGATKAMGDYMLANTKKDMTVSCHPQVSLEGFSESEEEILLPAAQEYAKCFKVDDDDGILPRL